MKSDADRQYTRAKLMSVFNHKAFPQRKDVRLVSASEIFVSQESDEESKVDHQIALIDPDEFTETGSAFKILNSSLGVITYDVDLTKLVAEIRAN